MDEHGPDTWTSCARLPSHSGQQLRSNLHRQNPLLSLLQQNERNNKNIQLLNLHLLLQFPCAVLKEPGSHLNDFPILKEDELLCLAFCD